MKTIQAVRHAVAAASAVTFSSEIKTARAEAALTQAEAAKVLKIARRALQHWEDGQREPIYPAQVGALILLRAEKAKHSG